RRVVEATALSMVAGIQFQPGVEPQVVLLSPAAMRAQDQAYRHLLAGRWEMALAAVDHADSLAPEARYELFHASNAGYRALALVQLRRHEEAMIQASRAVAADERDQNGWRALAMALALPRPHDDALAAPPPHHP